jgi:cytochrome P450
MEAALNRVQRALDTNRIARADLLRRHFPVLRLGSLVVVTRRDDVVDILTRPDTFSLPYASRLHGRFLLGLEGDEHAAGVAELRRVLRNEDVPRVAALVSSTSEEIVERCRAQGELDVGTDLVYPVMIRSVMDYLGLREVDPDDLLRWSREMFQNIFLNPADLPEVSERARQAQLRMNAVVAQVVERVRTSPSMRSDAEQTVVARMVTERRELTAEDSDDIRDNLVGLAIGWLWHGARAALIATDEVLKRPDLLARARTAATDEDLPALRRVLWEVLRFRPVQPGLFRECVKSGVIGPGTSRERRVRQGDRVFVGTHSAMWDEAAVPDARDFLAERAEGQYLIFGAGSHTCLGLEIMRVQLPALLAPLLREPGLQRAFGLPGRLRYRGAAVDGFLVTVGG